MGERELECEEVKEIYNLLERCRVEGVVVEGRDGLLPHLEK